MATILVIEDSSEIRENTAELLELQGFDILEASNGSDGYQMAVDHLPDVIVCDVKMPGMDGYEVLNSVKANKKTKDIPFIFCTASAQKDDIRKGVESDAYEYITKPYDENELFRILDRVLNS